MTAALIVWTVDATGDKLLTDAERPLGRIRDDMRAIVDKGLGTPDPHLVVLRGSRFTQIRGRHFTLFALDGRPPLEGLREAALSDWTEIPRVEFGSDDNKRFR